LNSSGSKKIFMSNEGQTKVLAADSGTTVSPDIALNGRLAAANQALEGIRGAERLSGLARFASKVQGFFETSLRSRVRSAPRLRVAPMVMAAGVLLLIVTGLLFVFSQPESVVQGHFHQPRGLNGAEDQKQNTIGSDSVAALAEDQLIATNGATDSRKSKTSSPEANSNVLTHRLGLSNDASGINNQPDQHFPIAANELQAPATVFSATAALNSSSNSLNPVPQTEQTQSQLPAGTEIVAHTTNAISSGLESPVVAIVDRDVNAGHAIIIPQGSRVIGYTAGAVKDRINVRFTSVLLADQGEIKISALALMRDGSAGLVGKVQGSGHPILAGAGRVATGAAVAATELAGQDSGSLNQPFSQGAYLRNQLAGEVASEGTRESGRLQQPTTVSIVRVNTNQSIRIFLLNPLTSGHPSSTDTPARNPQPTPSPVLVSSPTDENVGPEQALVGAQSEYIQALEGQLAELRAELDASKKNARR
jgi:type IV secretory pathway VirB10-like protein